MERFLIFNKSSLQQQVFNVRTEAEAQGLSVRTEQLSKCFSGRTLHKTATECQRIIHHNPKLKFRLIKASLGECLLWVELFGLVKKIWKNYKIYLGEEMHKLV